MLRIVTLVVHDVGHLVELVKVVAAKAELRVPGTLAVSALVAFLVQRQRVFEDAFHHGRRLGLLSVAGFWGKSVCDVGVRRALRSVAGYFYWGSVGVAS